MLSSRRVVGRRVNDKLNKAQPRDSHCPPPPFPHSHPVLPPFSSLPPPHPSRPLLDSPWYSLNPLLQPPPHSHTHTPLLPCPCVMLCTCDATHITYPPPRTHTAPLAHTHTHTHLHLPSGEGRGGGNPASEPCLFSCLSPPHPLPCPPPPFPLPFTTEHKQDASLRFLQSILDIRSMPYISEGIRGGRREGGKTRRAGGECVLCE